MKKSFIFIILSIFLMLFISSCNNGKVEKVDLTYELGELSFSRKQKDGYYYLTVGIPFTNTSDYKVIPSITMIYLIGNDEFKETGGGQTIAIRNGILNSISIVNPNENRLYSIGVKTDREEPVCKDIKVSLTCVFDVNIINKEITTYHHPSINKDEVYDCDVLRLTLDIEKKYLHLIPKHNCIIPEIYVVGTKEGSENIYCCNTGGYILDGKETSMMADRKGLTPNILSIMSTEFRPKPSKESNRDLKLSDYTFSSYFIYTLDM